ncbi:hypothetical protein AMJ48_02330 [Parcubacteria bacterium DG_74_1]|nr:MAG: hypothetical protein AMJ48_02330 [Parcubacteria bacterium DG_74_1]
MTQKVSDEKLGESFRHDNRKNGWKLIEDASEMIPLPVNQLALNFFLSGEEDCISGEEVIKCAKEMQVNFGQRQAEYLLKHQEEIPEDWRQYYLLFPGTIWRTRRGFLAIPCLFCFKEDQGNDSGWHFRFFCLDNAFGRQFRLLRPREYPNRVGYFSSLEV